MGLDIYHRVLVEPGRKGRKTLRQSGVGDLTLPEHTPGAVEVRKLAKDLGWLRTQTVHYRDLPAMMRARGLDSAEWVYVGASRGSRSRGELLAKYGRTAEDLDVLFCNIPKKQKKLDWYYVETFRFEHAVTKERREESFVESEVLTNPAKEPCVHHREIGYRRKGMLHAFYCVGPGRTVGVESNSDYAYRHVTDLDEVKWLMTMVDPDRDDSRSDFEKEFVDNWVPGKSFLTISW